jgi:hypothetical protein
VDDRWGVGSLDLEQGGVGDDSEIRTRLTESFESGSDSSQVCDSCRASRLAHKARSTVCDCCIPPHILISGDANHITISH